jgi:hypothetical protein
LLCVLWAVLFLNHAKNFGFTNGKRSLFHLST